MTDRLAARTYRSRGQAIGIATFAIGSFAISAPSIVALARTDGGPWWPALTIAVLVWGVFAMAAVRGARARVVVGPTGVRVVNPFKSVDAAWQDIRRFYVEEQGFFAPCGRLELVDGRSVRLFAVQGSSFARGRRHVEDLVEALNDELRERR